MPNPNQYECKACGAKFDSQEKLDNHNKQKHPTSTPVGASASSSGMGRSGGSTPPEKKNM